MTETVEGRTPGVVIEAKEKSQDVLADAQEQVASKAHELGGEAVNQIRAQLDQRSTQAGEQVQAVGTALQSGVTQLQVEGQDLPAKIVADVARRTDDLGAYLKSAQADQILVDIEDFARRRPWLAAGAAALAGFMASRFVKASGDRRYAAASSSGGYPVRSLPAGDS
jgi:ElaB/YqjD/DUF883 family membrane-anchored ribosome-binding protein